MKDLAIILFTITTLILVVAFVIFKHETTTNELGVLIITGFIGFGNTKY